MSCSNVALIVKARSQCSHSRPGLDSELLDELRDVVKLLKKQSLQKTKHALSGMTQTVATSIVDHLQLIVKDVEPITSKFSSTDFSCDGIRQAIVWDK